MPLSIRNLRRGVLAGGITLLVVVAAFLVIARLEGHGLHFNLPGRLGADISQTADGFTWSQSQKGHTLFTIHASKLVEYKGDQAELHDVTITLYGAEGSGRSDKIYGSDFLYDRKQGIARATGAVQIDFASPDVRPDVRTDMRTAPGSDTAGSPAGAGAAPPGQAANTIHVNTSGVVFNQKTGDATTDQRVDFVLPRATGSALGASYNAKEGVLILDQSVELVARPAAQGPGSLQAPSADDTVLHAAHAQLLRETHQAYLLQADAASGGRHTASDQAIVTFRQDGSAQLIDARGHVRITTEDGSQVHAANAVIDLDAASHPTLADLSGGVTYFADQDGRTMQGSAVSGTLSFTAAATTPGAGNPARQSGQQLHHAQFRNAVAFVLQQHSLPGDPNGSATREMHASTVDIDFAPGADGRSQAQQVLGAGGARANLHDVPSKGPATTTLIEGDQLLATLADGREFRVLDGKGDTKVVDTAANGATSTSTGDTLHVTFSRSAAAGAGAKRVSGSGAGAAGAASAEGAASAQVDTAVQTGHVSLDQTPAAGAKNADGSASSPFHATAQQAVYHASDQVLHLTGDPHLRSDTFALSADEVAYHRDSGDAAAIGSVKSTYLPQNGPSGQSGPSLGGSGPVHVTADHADLVHSSNTSLFYGSPGSGTGSGQMARLWQGGDSVAAPVIELDQDDQTLDAHGERGGRTAVVHATLGAKMAGPAGSGRGSSPDGAAALVAARGVSLGTSSGSAQGANSHADVAKNAADSKALSASESPTRLSSVTLHYSDKDHVADLRGLVTAEQPTGVLRADQAQVYLSQADANKPSQLDRMVATGHVVLVQPGRRGTGEKLVYTASDSRYVLTGAPGQQPRLVDAQRGTTTGTALIFKASDDSVEVSSNMVSGNVQDASQKGASMVHTRTVTDTRTPR